MSRCFSKTMVEIPFKPSLSAFNSPTGPALMMMTSAEVATSMPLAAAPFDTWPFVVARCSLPAVVDIVLFVQGFGQNQWLSKGLPVTL